MATRPNVHCSSAMGGKQCGMICNAFSITLSPNTGFFVYSSGRLRSLVYWPVLELSQEVAYLSQPRWQACL